jgi:hypothetical protein
MYESVERVMDIDFIYFDIILVTIWITALLLRKRYREMLFGLFGFLVVFFVDEVWWYHVKHTRIIEGPIQGDLFLLYFSFTYGVIMFSFAPLMFNRKIDLMEKICWITGMFGGWLLIGFLSQTIPWNDAEMSIGRNMNTARLVQILMVVIGYAILIALKLGNNRYFRKIHWSYFLVLFAIGIFIHFSMEFTLWATNIRPTHWDVLIFNSLLEFNEGIPILFGMWVFFNKKDYLSKTIHKKTIADYYFERNQLIVQEKKERQLEG